MRKSKIINLNVGDELFNYQSFKGIFTYKIVGVREYENSRLYEIKCQECRDHAKCRVLVSQIDNLPQFQYVQMLNEDEENEQYYWHNNQVYFVSKNDCKKHAYNKAIEYHKKEIEKLENSLKKQKERLAEIQSLVDGVVS